MGIGDCGGNPFHAHSLSICDSESLPVMNAKARTFLAMVTLIAIFLTWIIAFAAGTAYAHSVLDVSHEADCSAAGGMLPSGTTPQYCALGDDPITSDLGGTRRFQLNRQDAAKVELHFPTGTTWNTGRVICLAFNDYRATPGGTTTVSSPTLRYGSIDSLGTFKDEAGLSASTVDIQFNTTGYYPNAAPSGGIAIRPLWYWLSDLPASTTACRAEDQGAPPSPINLDDPVVTCTRSLSTNNDTNIGTFNATVSNPPTPNEAGADSFSWDWGDSTAAGTTANAQHVYPATATMPSGGWTATLTITRTPGNGYVLTGDGISTCSLRVDFLNPTQSTGDGFDSGDDNDCPSGWGWLNPAAVGAILKCLFIPTGDSWTLISTLWGDMTTKFPFSWAYETVMVPADMVNEIRSGLDYNPVCGSIGGVQHVWMGGTSGSNCDALGTGQGVDSWLGHAKNIQLALFVTFLGFATYQMIVRLVR